MWGIIFSHWVKSNSSTPIPYPVDREPRTHQQNQSSMSVSRIFPQVWIEISTFSLIMIETGTDEGQSWFGWHQEVTQWEERCSWRPYKNAGRTQRGVRLTEGG